MAICDRLNQHNIQSKYQRFLNQTVDKVVYTYAGNGLYDDEDGVRWYHNNNNIPIQKYNPDATILNLAGSLIKTTFASTSKDFEPILTFDRAEVNQRSGNITFDNEADTKLAQQLKADKTSVFGTISSQKENYHMQKDLLLPTLLTTSVVDYAWTDYKDFS